MQFAMVGADRLQQVRLGCLQPAVATSGNLFSGCDLRCTTDDVASRALRFRADLWRRQELSALSALEADRGSFRQNLTVQPSRNTATVRHDGGGNFQREHDEFASLLKDHSISAMILSDETTRTLVAQRLAATSSPLAAQYL